MTPDELSERLLGFAVRAAGVAEALPNSRLGRHVAGQLVRSGTAGPPNYEEGCAAESRRDFAHKLNVCLKELRESRVWIRFIIKARLMPEARLEPLLDEADQLCNILARSVATAKGKRRSSAPNVPTAK
jgi:four helix bundle protein